MSLTAVLAVSAALGACGRSGGGNGDWQASTSSARICVDAQGRRLSDQICEGTGEPYVGGHSWYFIPGAYVKSNGVPRVGADASGGALQPSSGVSYVEAPPYGIARGGFGATGEAAGAHGAGE